MTFTYKPQTGERAQAVERSNMKKNRSILRTAAASTAALTVAASMIMLFPSSALADTTDGKVQTYEEQLAAYENRQAEAEARRLEALQNLNDAEAYRAALYESLELMERKLDTYSAMIVELDKQIDEKNRLIAETEQKIADTREQFLNRMTSVYEEGNVSYIELILGAEDISDFLSRVDNITAIMEYDQNMIDSLTESKKTLNTALEELEAARKAQEDTFKTLQNDRAEYTALLEEANRSVSLYQNLMSSAEQDELNAKLAAQKIDAELAEYLAQLAAQQNQQNQQNQPDQPDQPNLPGTPIQATGEFTWPLTDYVYISSHFGGRILDGEYEYHPATDIAAYEGTPIYAAGSGTVLRSEWNDSYGYYVLIDHGNGRSTLYAHQCQQPYVSAGNTVTAGQPIGLVGNTGYSKGAHLHFEFRIGGEKVDAEQYVTPPHQ